MLALIPLLLSCQLPNSGTAELPRIKLAVAIPITGSLSSKGPSRLKAAELAMEHINQAGGIGNIPLKLYPIDSATNGTIAAQRVRELLDQHPDIQALIGPSSSQESLQVLEVMKSRQKPMISPASTSATFTTLDDGGYFFRTVPSDAFQGQILAAKIRDFNFKKIGLLYVNNAYGQSLHAVVKTEVEKHGGQIVSAVSYPEAVQSRYDSEINRLLETKPEAVCFIGYPGEAPGIFNSWLASGKSPQLKWFFSDGLKAAEILQGVSNPLQLDGSLGTLPGTSSQPEDSQFFQDAYVQKYGEFPQSYASNSYDAVILAALALQRSQNAHNLDLRQAIREVASPPGIEIRPGQANLQQALKLLSQGQDIDYQGVSGDLNMDAVGDVRNHYEIWTLKNGFIFRVETFSINSLNSHPRS